MWLRILGLPDGMTSWWQARHLAEGDGAAVDRLLRRHLPGHRFSVGDVPLAELPVVPGTARAVLTVVARPETAGPPGRDSGPEVVMVTTGGPDAGHLAPLPRSGLTIGRNHAEVRLADPFLSSPHFRVVVDPEGVRIVHLADHRGRPPRREETPAGHGPGAGPWDMGSSTFRLVRGRPGPVPARSPVPALSLDPGPEPSRPNPLLQAVMALGPLVIGVIMAAVTGHWFFLLFSLVSVAGAAVMWAQHRSARLRYGQRIRQQADEVAARIEAVAPGPGDLALAARSEAPDRFGVRGDSTGPPIIRWGTGTATLPMASERVHGDWSAWARTPVALVGVLSAGAVTRVVGQRATLERIVPWLTVQLCRDAVASHRGVLIRSGDRDRWLGGKASTAEGTAVLYPGTSGAGLPADWHRVLLQDNTSSDTGPAGGDLVLPEEGSAILGGLEYTGLRWHGMSASTADWLLDELGAIDRPRWEDTPPWLHLPGDGLSQTAITSLRCGLTGEDDPVVLDLVRDGPHALVTGTTGSGKSELLLTALTGLAAAYPPAEASFVLMDFKGGSSFAPLSGLPHTMSVETNLVEAESLRTFDALTAELRRREELFLASGSADYAAFRRSRPHEVLPRLVVAIDELRVLVEDHPRAATVLARLAATGRSLGFHLVLATQRAQGAVSPDVRSNLGTVICLRTATEQESWDLLGSAAAHALDADRPGHAFIRHGGGPPRSFRAGRFAGTPGAPELVPWDGRVDAGDLHGRPDEDPAEWPRLVARIGSTAKRLGLLVPDPVVMPALPDHWCPTAAERLAHPGAVVVGLADLPGDRRQEPVTWVPGRDGPVAWIGSDAGGLRDAARSLLRQLGAPPAVTPASASPVRTVVLDGEGEVGTLEDGVIGATATGRTQEGDQWTVLSPAGTTPERLGAVVGRVREDLASHRAVRLVVTAWGRWAGLRVGTGYETVEEHVALLLRDHPPHLLAVALFGGRDLAGGRVLGQVPNRFYVPAGSTPEQRMVWPTLHRVREVPGRAVMVTPEHPAPGVAVQLGLDLTGPA